MLSCLEIEFILEWITTIPMRTNFALVFRHLSHCLILYPRQESSLTIVSLRRHRLLLIVFCLLRRYWVSCPAPNLRSEPSSRLCLFLSSSEEHEPYNDTTEYSSTDSSNDAAYYLILCWSGRTVRFAQVAVQPILIKLETLSLRTSGDREATGSSFRTSSGSGQPRIKRRSRTSDVVHLSVYVINRFRILRDGIGGC